MTARLEQRGEALGGVTGIDSRIGHFGILGYLDDLFEIRRPRPARVAERLAELVVEHRAGPEDARQTGSVIGVWLFGALAAATCGSTQSSRWVSN